MKKAFLFSCLFVVVNSLHSQWLDDNFEKYYLMGNYDLIHRKALELDWQVYYDERGVIGSESVYNKVTIQYLTGDNHYSPNYDYRSYEIGKLENGNIIAYAFAYRMSFGMLYSLGFTLDRYVFALDRVEIFDNIFDYTEKSEVLQCGNKSTDLRYSENLHIFDMLGSWIELTKGKWNCNDYALFHTRNWNKSRFGLHYSSELRDFSLPSSLRTTEWHKRINEINDQGLNSGGGSYNLTYEMTESELAKMIGLESELYSTVALKKDLNGQFWLSPMIDGKYKYEMMFDTGASLTTLSNSHKATFIDLGITKPTGEYVTVTTADGSSSRNQIFLCDIKLGERMIENVEIIYTGGTPLFGMNITKTLKDWKIQGSNLIYKK